MIKRMMVWVVTGHDLLDLFHAVGRQYARIKAQKQNNAAKYDLFTKRAAVALAIGDIKSEIEKEQ